MSVEAPFPWFGGKRDVAPQVWDALGNVAHYVEPFFGSGAVLLQRPHSAKFETVNDVDGLLANFWRAVRADSQAVADHADWPCNEADLHARHVWLVGQRERLTERLMGDAEYFDAKAAGWWVWGSCNWIGSGWCSGQGPWISLDGELRDVRQLPHLSSAQGVNRKLPHLSEGRGVNRKLPHLSEGRGVNRKLPHLSSAQGVNRKLPHLSEGRGVNRKLPHLSEGRGVNRKLPHLSSAQGVNRKLPHLSEGRGVNRKLFIESWFAGLADRLRDVRVACGDWTRVTGPAVLDAGGGTTGIFLDPPYSAEEHSIDYADGQADVARDVFAWCAENGDNPTLRIVLAGYSGEHNDLEAMGWRSVAWKARGGYGSQGDGRGRDNAKRERLWLSPHCMGVAPDLFAGVAA